MGIARFQEKISGFFPDTKLVRLQVHNDFGTRPFILRTIRFHHKNFNENKGIDQKNSIKLEIIKVVFYLVEGSVGRGWVGGATRRCTLFNL